MKSTIFESVGLLIGFSIGSLIDKVLPSWNLDVESYSIEKPGVFVKFLLIVGSFFILSFMYL